MSFFAGKVGGGQNVVSMRIDNGGDINAHESPSNESIFHSKMPHLFIKKRFGSNLYDSGNGYYRAPLPDDLPSLLNDRRNVILVILVFKKNGREYRKQLNGIGTSGGSQFVFGGLGITLARMGHLSFDINLEWGYTKYSGGDFHQCIKDGTSPHHCLIGSAGDDYSPGTMGMLIGAERETADYTNVSEDRALNKIFPANGGGPESAVGNEVGGCAINPDYMFPMGPSQGGPYNHIYIRKGGARSPYGGIPGGNFNQNADGTPITPAYCRARNTDNWIHNNGVDSSCIISGSPEAIRNAGYTANIAEASYDIDMVSVEFLQLNLLFDVNSGYQATDNFLNNYGSIKLSRQDFVVSGWDFRATDIELLTTVSRDNPQAANNAFSANVDTGWVSDLEDGGAFRLCGTASNGDMISINANNVDNNVGSAPQWNIGTYKFPRNSSVEIDTKEPALKLNGQTIWGRNVRPLMMFPNNKSGIVDIGSNRDRIDMGNGGDNRTINSFGIGLPAQEISTVLMSIEWRGNNLISPDGDPGLGFIYNNLYDGTLTSPGHDVNTSVGMRVTKWDYDHQDAISHQILVLAPGRFIPFLNRNSVSYANTAGGKPKNRFQYYIRKNPDNGNIEIWACSRAVKFHMNGKEVSGLPNPRVQTPYMKVSFQRLT